MVQFDRDFAKFEHAEENNAGNLVAYWFCNTALVSHSTRPPEENGHEDHGHGGQTPVVKHNFASDLWASRPKIDGPQTTHLSY